MDGFRQMVKGWLGKALLALLAIPFVFVGMESYFAGSGAQSAAEVDDVTIPTVLLDRAVDNQRQQLLSRRGANSFLSPQEQAQLRQEVLNNLIERQLLLSSAQEAGYKVSDASVQQLIQQTPIFQDNGSFSTERYLQVLARIGETPNTFLARARQEILVSQHMSGWLQSGFVTPTEFDRMIELDGQTRDAVVWTLPASDYAGNVTVSDAEIQQRYEAAGDRFMLPERVAIRYMVLGKEGFGANVSVTEADIQARYDARLAQLSQQEQREAAHILITTAERSDAEAKAKAESLRAELAKGADFAALAKANSEDPGSASQGGQLGLVAKGMFVPEFEQALFALQSTGDLSPVVKTEFGYHIIQLSRLQKLTPPTLASLRTSLLAEAKAAKAEEQYLQAVERIDESVYEASELAEIAKQESLTLLSSPLMDRRGATGLLTEPKVIEAAFAEEQTKESRISGAITLADGRSLWLQVTEHKPARQQTLAEVSAVLKAELVQSKSKSAALMAAKNLLDKPEAEWGLSGVPQRVSGLSRQGQDGVSPVTARAVFMAKVPQGEKAIWSAVPTASGAALVQVTRVQAAKAPAEMEKIQLQTLLAQSTAQYELQEAIALLRARADIQVKAVAEAQ